MNRNIEHYILHKENFLDKKYCNDCIKELDKNTWEKHDWHNPKTDSMDKPSGNNEPENIRQGLFSDKVAKINTFIIQELHSIVLEYIQSFKFNWFNEWNGYSSLKFIRYSPDQRMQNHCDHIYSLFDGKRKGIPVLSIIGILNDDYDGGELIMLEDKKIDTKKGDLLMFPSNFLYPHEITPVTKGVRYSYTSWVW
jgi:predicted 2-oxoglutarate/Fe(II)-dependent dioxygenase YbiX